MTSLDSLRTASIVLGCVAASLAPASAQTTSQPIRRELTHYDWEWPYGRTATADLDDDGNVDAVYHVGFSVDVMIAPALYQSELTTLGWYNDFDTLIKPNGADSVLTVSAAGLYEHKMQPKPLLPVPQSYWDWTHVPRNQSTWAGATKVRTWMAPGQTTVAYVIGLAAADDAILIMKRDANATPVWSAGPTVDLPSGPAIVAIEPFDRDGNSNGLPEVAIASAGSMAVFAPWNLNNSTPIATYSAPTLTTVGIARVRQVGWTQEWMASITTLNSNTARQYLTLEGYNTTSQAYGIMNAQWLPDGLGISNLVAGDVSGDGNDELVVNMTSAWRLGVINNSSGGTVRPTFAASTGWPPSNMDLIDAPYEDDSYDNIAKPMVADLDNDGHNDCGIPVYAKWEIWFERNEQYITGLLQPELVLADSDTNSTADQLVGVQIAGTNAKQITFTFDMPAPPSGGWTANHYLRVTAWSRPTATDPIDPRAFFHPADICIQYDTDSTTRTYTATVPGNPTTAGHSFERIVFLVGQIVEIESGLVVRAYPGIVYVAHGAYDPTWSFDASCMDSCPGEEYDDIEACCGVNEAEVRELLDMQEQEHVEFAISSVCGLTAPLPNQLGVKVGLGGHVPCMPAPVSSPPRRD